MNIEELRALIASEEINTKLRYAKVISPKAKNGEKSTYKIIDFCHNFGSRVERKRDTPLWGTLRDRASVLESGH